MADYRVCTYVCVSVYITVLIPILGAELQSTLLLIEALHVVAICEKKQGRCTSCALSRRKYELLPGTQAWAWWA